jgi:hypothetical protein
MPPGDNASTAQHYTKAFMREKWRIFGKTVVFTMSFDAGQTGSVTGCRTWRFVPDGQILHH